MHTKLSHEMALSSPLQFRVSVWKFLLENIVLKSGFAKLKKKDRETESIARSGGKGGGGTSKVAK